MSCPKAGVPHTPDPPTMPPPRWPPSGSSSPRGDGDGDAGWLQPWDLPRRQLTWAVSSPLLSSKKEGAGLWASRIPKALGWHGGEDKRTALRSPATTLRTVPAAGLLPALLSRHKRCSIRRRPRTPRLPCAAQGHLCSLFADVQLLTDHLREISATEGYTVSVWAQEVDPSPPWQLNRGYLVVQLVR